MNNLLGVVAIESYYNCPAHDGGSYSGMKKVEDFEQLKDMVINGLNAAHVDDVLSFDGHDYEIKYVSSSHSYIGASIFMDGKKVCYTADNGSGKLHWINT